MGATEWKEFALFVLGICVACGGYFIRTMLSDLKELQKAMAEQSKEAQRALAAQSKEAQAALDAHRLHVSENYAKAAQFVEMREWLEKQFTRLYDLLEKKADKP